MQPIIQLFQLLSLQCSNTVPCSMLTLHHIRRRTKFHDFGIVSWIPIQTIVQRRCERCQSFRRGLGVVLMPTVFKYNRLLHGRWQIGERKGWWVTKRDNVRCTMRWDCLRGYTQFKYTWPEYPNRVGAAVIAWYCPASTMMAFFPLSDKIWQVGVPSSVNVKNANSPDNMMKASEYCGCICTGE